VTNDKSGAARWNFFAVCATIVTMRKLFGVCIVSIAVGLWGCGDNNDNSCPKAFTTCGDTCTDTQTDGANCGACGTVCGAGQACSAGACSATCPTGEVVCNAECVDTQRDSENCGACGSACGDGQVCGAGACSDSCPTGEIACNGQCVDPHRDNSFCGASADCEGANAGSACGPGSVCNGAGLCAQTCVGGELVCNGQCVDPDRDNTFCGASTDCEGANAGTTCDSGFVCDGTGTCALTCDSSRLECSGSCIDPMTDPNFCGATDCDGGSSGVTCAPNEACVAGGCQPLACNVDVAVELDYSGAPVTWTVPDHCFLVRFTVSGAQGGSATTAGGLGAQVASDVAVNAGETLTIIVGGSPTDGGNGGGGGTFVLRADGSLVIAAGGGGGGAGECCGTEGPGQPGVAAGNGTSGTDGGCDIPAGGMNGQGGLTGTGVDASTAGAGAGFLSDGTDGVAGMYDDPPSPGQGGKSPADGAAGGTGFTTGGYGGGGGASDNGFWAHGGGGGGGGYSGGSTSCDDLNWTGGGGGGSYNPGQNPIGLDGVQAGNGVVLIGNAN
jgi:hypothetical protein